MLDEDGDDETVVGQLGTTMVPKHIKKRSLRNKALFISFDEKNLRDFVTGFQKRKKKRRREAQQQIQEKERLKRIEARKKRKLEKENALFGATSDDANGISALSGPGEDVCCEDDVKADAPAAEPQTTTYEAGDTTIRVITSELSREDEEEDASGAKLPVTNVTDGVMEKKGHTIPTKKIWVKQQPRKKKSRKPAHGKNEKRKGRGRR